MNSAKLLPYRVVSITTVSPASSSVHSTAEIAAMPDATASPASAPSRSATRASSRAWVGFLVRP